MQGISRLAVMALGAGVAALASTAAIAQSGTARPSTPPTTNAPSTTAPTTTAPKPAPKPSMRELLRKGYEITAVTVLGPDMMSAVGNDPKNPQILVTLQKERKIAACQYSSGNWITLSETSIEGTTQCAVYP